MSYTCNLTFIPVSAIVMAMLEKHAPAAHEENHG